MLDHENIANLFGMAIFQDRIAMISPWIDPGDFYKFIKKFPGADRMGLCVQVANGLAYLHKQGVVHGDLKANNVLIGSEGIVKLTDFGLSVLAESNLCFSSTENPGCGTIRWMAPELFEELSKPSREADVYALAMTIIEILTDRVPFPQLSEMQVMCAVKDRSKIPERPEKLKEGVLRHDSWWLFLKKSWDRNKGTRPKASDWSSLDRELKLPLKGSVLLTIAKKRLLQKEYKH
ncbi:hypothetical protein FRC09_007656 [Ceratobasidium sp. 395]|nr:hypothetical protein FRC09_007656 [Ceratobasidium sp. 395]